MINSVKRVVLPHFLLLTPFLAFSPLAFANTEPVGLSFSSGLNVIGGLFLVLALFIACAWLMKRTQGGFLSASKEMKTLGVMSLGTRERAVLIEVEGKKLLLGVSAGRVNTLHVFDEPSGESQANETQLNDAENTAIEHQEKAQKSDFASQLMQLLPKNNTASDQNHTASK